MATGADIPPELIQHILEDVCEDASELLNLDEDVPNRKEAIKKVTACSLTCVRWARICRRELFRSVWIKSYEDMRIFSSLVASTPKRFRPISYYVSSATLEQRIGDRPWIHLFWMQPSLFQFDSDVYISINITDSDSDTGDGTVTSQWSAHRRLFAGLPRTPPTVCLRCDNLNIVGAHFGTPHNLASLLGRFISPSTKQPSTMMLNDVTWSAQTHFVSDLLTRHSLDISEDDNFGVSATGSQYPAETVWLAFATRLHYISQRSTLPGLHQLSKKTSVVLRIAPPAQRTILAICTLLSRIHNYKILEVELARFVTDDPPQFVILSEDCAADVRGICKMFIKEGGPDVADPRARLFLRFCHADLIGYGGPIRTVEHISILCISVERSSTDTAASSPSSDWDDSNYSSPVIQHGMAYPWEELVGICADQERFMRLQLTFENEDDLVQFMQTQRAALTRLHGRVHLFYRLGAPFWDIIATDFTTLKDLPGDAWEDYGYVGIRFNTTSLASSDGYTDEDEAFF